VSTPTLRHADDAGAPAATGQLGSTEAADGTLDGMGAVIGDETGSACLCGPALAAALTAIARKSQQISGEPVNVTALLATSGAIKHLTGVTSLPVGKVLRRAGRQALTDSDLLLDMPTDQMPGRDVTAASSDVDLACALTDPDAEVSAAAAQAISTQLDDERRARRARRRRSTTSAEERAAERERAKLATLRDARDRANAKAQSADDQARALRDQLAELTGELAALSTQLQAAEQRLQTARADAHSPEHLAGILSGVLRRRITAAETDPSDPERPTQSGESGPLPARSGHTHTAEQTTAQLRTAAELAGLPVQLAERAEQWLPPLLGFLASPPALTQAMSVRELTVQVLGGGTEVGGSCVLVTAGDTRLLIDAGSRPGGTDAACLAPRRIDVALAGRLDAIVITHAHNDHVGWVPAVVASQPDVPVFVTDATAALLATMWVDSAKVLRNKARDAAGDDGANVLPPYNDDDVKRAISRLHIQQTDQTFRIGQLHLQLFSAGHIVGAVGVVVHAGEQRAVISGDVSLVPQATVGGIEIPDAARGADLLLLESTYAGSGRMTPRDAVLADFLRDVSSTVEGGGTVLVPAFALGRAQEVALILSQHLPEVPVLVDGLARDVCRIYSAQPGPDGEPMNIFGGKVREVPRLQTTAEIARMCPGVVVATSGMMHGGPSVEWARKILPDPRNRLMIVGYQDPESPGRRLADLAGAGGGKFELITDRYNEMVDVNAAVGTYQLGAHADADALVEISRRIAARDLMLVHGERHKQQEFARRLATRQQRTLLADAAWVG
jgi:Cft2 family RNA processing exonuclease